MNVVYWVLVVIVCITIETVTISLTTIWFAGGALFAMFINLCGGDLLLQVIVFLTVSFLLLIFTRPVARKYLNAKTTPTNINAVIGRRVVVTEQIDGLRGTGAVQIGGLTWSARAFREETSPIKEGEVVKVIAVEGVKLLVEPVNLIQEDIERTSQMPGQKEKNI